MRSPESGPSMESEYEPYDEREMTPEEHFRDLARHETENIRWETVDPATREIAQKVLFKLDLKADIEEMDRHKDDTTRFQRMKKLGIFVVFYQTAEHDWKDPSSGFELKKGDHFLDLHLPPVRDVEKLLSTASQSFQMIAEYIKKQELNPKYVMGVTYERLAKVSRRFGFQVFEPEIPDDIRSGVERVYQRFAKSPKESKPIGKILLCCQRKDDFLKRFAKT